MSEPDDDNDNDTPAASDPIELADAYAELQNLILDTPDVNDFLHQLATLAAAIVPGTHSGITLRRDHQIATVASSDAVAMRMDEVQYHGGRGPCLEAMHRTVRVDVPDITTETRWGDYATEALANGIHSAFSLPLTVNGDTLGALNLFSSTAHAFTEPDIARAQAFTRQAATALSILLRHARQTELDEQLRDALATRAVIDQALGILMATHKITSREAFAILRHTSQNKNRKVSDIAADLIQHTTGHPPQPPTPLSQRD